ncbi:MAG TPA: CHAD domain-containing protein [Telluria sp.]|nr:CHAD domain-containing protein [Telluria sp.]
MDTAVTFPATPKAVKAAPLKLRRGMSAEQAFERIVASCLAQIAANEAGVAQFHDIESLHQMRVGLRRLRAAFAMFSDWLAPPVSLSNELDWLTGELGPARDWDVLLASTLPSAEHALPAGQALPEISKLVQEGADALHVRAAAAVASPRFRALIDGLDQWRRQRAWRDMLSEARQALLLRRATAVAAEILKDDQRRMEKRGRKLKAGGPQERHRLRIAAKRTRYAAEFFASLYPKRRVRPYVAALSTLQDELGAMNDAAVADGLLAALAAEHGNACAEAGYVRGFLAVRNEQRIGKLAKLWKKFKPMRPPH